MKPIIEDSNADKSGGFAVGVFWGALVAAGFLGMMFASCEGGKASVRREALRLKHGYGRRMDHGLTQFRWFPIRRRQ